MKHPLLRLGTDLQHRVVDSVKLVFIGSNLRGIAAEVGNDMYQEEPPVFMHWTND